MPSCIHQLQHQPINKDGPMEGPIGEFLKKTTMVILGDLFIFQEEDTTKSNSKKYLGIRS